MCKRKHKSGKTDQSKQQQAHFKNEYISRLKKFCDQVSQPGVANLIPASELETLYLLRTHPVNVVAEKGVPTRVIKECKSLLLSRLKTELVPFEVGAVTEISLYDFFSLSYTLMLYAQELRTDQYAQAAKVKQALALLANMPGSGHYNNAWNRYSLLNDCLGTMLSNMTGTLYSISLNLRTSLNGCVGLWVCCTVHAFSNQTTRLSIQGNRREACRVAHAVADPEAHLDCVELKEGDALLQKKLHGGSAPVYIQAHALNRLQERLDGVSPEWLHYFLYLSLKQPRLCRNAHGTLLIEFRLYEKKVGYLPAELHEGKILIRTFLFLTNTGTPEAERLKRYSGLGKEDIKYLNIGKLSSFLLSDIDQNPSIKQLFLKAGCQTLFELDRKLISSTEHQKEKALGQRIAAYLNLNFQGGSGFGARA